jgi:hypothetical protein
MQNSLAATFVLALLAVTTAAAQQAPPSSSPNTPTSNALAPLTLTGCVSPKPGASGQYVFEEEDGVGQYRLNGKGIKKFAGQRVELVAGSGSKALAIRGGLWPSPNVAGRGGDIDPAQESIARQPGGGGAGAGPEFPELRVTRLKTVQGECK